MEPAVEDRLARRISHPIGSRDTAMITRISTGISVQATSSTVLCEVRDGFGLALRRKRML